MNTHERYPWNKAQKTIFMAEPKAIPPNTKLEYLHRQIHEILIENWVMNRLELIYACEDKLGAATKQDVNRHVSDYKRLALEEELITIYDPQEFLSENPPEDVGIAVSKHGGYTLLDENMSESYNFRTAEDALIFVRENPDLLREKDKPLVLDTKIGIFRQTFPPKDLGDMSLGEALQKPNDKIKKPKRITKVNTELREAAEKTLENIELE